MPTIVAEAKGALYFGCLDELGHYLCSRHQGRLQRMLAAREIVGFPWTMGHLDGGLLKNGKHADRYDGKVFWTCGGTPLWHALVWWDNSVDRRGASNSGFYVRGFDHHQVAEALEYAGTVWPDVIARQRQPLALQP